MPRFALNKSWSGQTSTNHARHLAHNKPRYGMNHNHSSHAVVYSAMPRFIQSHAMVFRSPTPFQRVSGPVTTKSGTMLVKGARTCVCVCVRVRVCVCVCARARVCVCVVTRLAHKDLYPPVAVRHRRQEYAARLDLRARHKGNQSIYPPPGKSTSALICVWAIEAINRF